MSTAIALTWADRHRDRVDHAYLWGPPIYPDDTAAQAVAEKYGPMGRLFALDTKSPVTVFRGTDDPIGDRTYIAKIIGSSKIVDVPGADHHVALQHPQLLFDALDER